jgi:hypothetical protein
MASRFLFWEIDCCVEGLGAYAIRPYGMIVRMPFVM